MAVLLVCATFALITAGGLVTTYEAGMAVYDWPTTFGHNMFLYPLADWLSGPFDVFIEHGHRLLGSLVGMISIAFLAVTWKFDERRWMRNLAVVALGAVIVQGVLGGMRVMFDARTMAMIHGCVGPAFFALTIALAATTSRWWREHTPTAAPGGNRLLRLSAFVVGMAWFQIFLGATLRHFHVGVWPHIVMGIVLAGHIVWLAVLVRRTRQPLLVRPAAVLTLLLIGQLALGVAAWVTNHGWPSWFAGYRWAAAYVVQANSMQQVWSTTLHVTTGSLILAFSVLLAVRTWRLIAITQSAGADAPSFRFSGREVTA